MDEEKTQNLLAPQRREEEGWTCREDANEHQPFPDM